MITPAKALRFWQMSQPLRARFGLVDGLRITDEIADLTYRKANLPFVAINVPGWRDPLWLRPNTTDLDAFQELVAKRGLDLDLPHPPRRILDGGANVGIASRIFAHRWPEAQIAAVELEGRNFEALKKNCECTPRVTPRWAALWNERGSVGVNPAGYGELGFRADTAFAGLRVPAIPLDDLFDDLGWDTVDLVKLDIEGAERQVLATASRWIDRVTHLAIELHDRFAPGCTAAFESAIDRRTWTVGTSGEYLVASRRVVV